MPDAAQSNGRSKGMANLKMWQPGQSGNPGGTSRRVREYRAIIEHQETPARVAEVVDKLRTLCLEQDSDRAGVAYLKVVGMFDDHNDSKIKGAVEDKLREMLADAEAAIAAEKEAETREGAITVTASEAGAAEPSDDGGEKP